MAKRKMAQMRLKTYVCDLLRYNEEDETQPPVMIAQGIDPYEARDLQARLTREALEPDEEKDSPADLEECKKLERYYGRKG